MAQHKIDKQQILDILKKRWWIMLIEFAVLAIIITLDLVSKQYVCKFLSTQPGLRYNLIDKFIELQYTENTGAGFGVFSGKTLALTVITIIVVAGLFGYLFLAQKQSEWLRVALIFISAGGIGNVVDRLALGYVRDFIRFSFWEDFAIFNVADAFVTVGAFILIVVLIIMLIMEGRKGKKAFEEEQKQALENGETATNEPLVDPYELPVNEFLDSDAPQNFDTQQDSVDSQDDGPAESKEE